ncbi:unnamed protein product [Rotaria sp. Silwood2]|nr:unnamed protein product [Rotaria sp. Silwood2]
MKRNNNQKSKSINNLLIHFIAILIFSTRELITYISYSNFNIEIIYSLYQISSFTNITDLLQLSQPYFYLQEHQTFKLFLIILNRLISSSSTSTTISINLTNTSTTITIQQTNYRSSLS